MYNCNSVILLSPNANVFVTILILVTYTVLAPTFAVETVTIFSIDVHFASCTLTCHGLHKSSMLLNLVVPIHTL